MQKDPHLRHYNLQRLRGLAMRHSSEITLFCAHDPTEFERLEELERVPADSPLRVLLAEPEPTLHA
jgi:hypothetical protein